MMSYLSVNTIAEWSCFLTGVFCLRNDESLAWKCFPAYLLVVCLTETLGIHIRVTNHVSNAFLYNYYLPIECICISIFLFLLMKPFGIKRWLLLVWLGIFFTLYLIESFYNHFSKYSSQVVVLMAVVFVCTSLYYHYQVLESDAYIRLGNYAPFWWVNGVLIFYFGGIVTNIFFKYLLHTPAVNSVHYSLRYIIFSILNIVLYGSWIYAFICRYRQQK
ncbi:hypothetical protein ACE38W_14145 [Chitinophaga sp. Hz27]|uniref:hypothetical protein n=1 Tax=Chitinophaga sp. Hz27 TaxID=3347169 RepID=UPI0035D88589